MNKAELVDAIAKDAKITKGQAQEAVDALFTHVRRSLKRGEKVTLVGFGTFASSRRAARMGRNPQTGAPIRIPARKVARFTPGKGLKDAIQ
jgi:DNA-binding protein HU-beta